MRFIWIFLLPIALFGKPKGHKVVEGTAKVQEIGSTMEIQTSDRAIINWEEFSIRVGETTRFVQPHTTSAVLNRVANGASHIDGLLEANGRIYLLNPNGVLIGPTGNIQAESFIASTLDF
ncbi:MAG: Heme/hemopexin-binding protein, partial [Chlamydiae bacterium]|nr:Heme/hemopexin-binding protein [Chlamydiota bacterium]